MLMDPDAAPEGFTHLTYEIEGIDGGGWSWILSDLKSLLKTGSTLAG